MKQQHLPVSVTGFHLKIIAILSMTLDHIGSVFFTPEQTVYIILRSIGRIAFPLFSFLLVEGFLHTSNYRNYLGRMFLFALISEIPFDVALYHFPANLNFSILFHHQNVFFTLGTGLLAMYLMERYCLTCPILSWLAVAAAIFVAQKLRFDYGGYGILVILLFYGYQRFYRWVPPLIGYVLAFYPLLVSGNWRRFFVLFALLPILFYRGEKGGFSIGRRRIPGGKYFFYWYYPAHLFLLAALYSHL